MAKNRKDEHYPVVRSGRLGYAGPASTPQMEVNVEQLLAKVNRRLYRQSRCYTVKLDIDADSTQTYNVFALSDSWMNERALKMAYAMYLENSGDERDRLKEDVIARWEDFRTRSGFGFQQVSPQQYDNTLTASILTSGEFNLTQVVDSAGVSRGFTWGTPNPALYGITQEYDKAGNAQQSPTSATGDMPYDDLMADDSAVMASKLQTNGDNPPYDALGVNGDRTWVKVATLAAGAAQRLSTGFFKAPCGIVLITAGAGSELVAVDKFEWTVKGGDYKGVHAPNLIDGALVRHSSGTLGRMVNGVWRKI